MNRRCGGRQPTRVQKPVTHVRDLCSDARRQNGVWYEAGKEEDSETDDENVPLPVPKSARVVPGRRHNGRSFALAARRHYQIALGTFLKFVKERALPLVGRCPGCAVE